jgi:hypothetical protein
MQAFQKYPNFQKNFGLEKILMEGRCVREMSRELGPWLILVPPIMVKLLFLDSVKTNYQKLIHSHGSGTIFNFSHISIFKYFLHFT